MWAPASQAPGHPPPPVVLIPPWPYIAKLKIAADLKLAHPIALAMKLACVAASCSCLVATGAIGDPCFLGFVARAPALVSEAWHVP